MTARRGMWLGALVATMLVAWTAEAEIAIRPASPLGSFYFHGKYSRQPFDPSTGFGLQVWNCANGAMPTLMTDTTPLVACGAAPDGGWILADRVHEVALPAGACVDHGCSCYYRDRSARSSGGIRSLRIQYARRGHANRVWLESFGDLSGARQANMFVVITIDGVPRATMQDTFQALRNGGWFSDY
ncbi:MAG: hypothetical protein IT294_01310 [Deltaproteobacteria bacterium]|nr:hypothetical protein [Deltaproteobacteria bacterium]